PATLPGQLRVFDDAHLFSNDAVKQAERKLVETKFDHGFHFTVDTYPEIPADRKSGYSKDKEREFFKSWAQQAATGDKARGVYVLICMKPGWVEVLSDEESKNRGFNSAKAGELHKIFFDALTASAHNKTAEEQKQLRDKSLLDATDYVSKEVQGTKVL